MAYIYDKAEWHYEGDFPDDLPEEQAFVHTGMYLGWIIEKKLYSYDFQTNSADEIKAFEQRIMTGTEIYKKWDGCLVDDMLNDEGNQFTRYYYDSDKYLDDYIETLALDLPTEFHVKDSWGNYDKIRKVINARYAEWKKTR